MRRNTLFGIQLAAVLSLTAMDWTFAQTLPLHLGSAAPIVDEFGEKLNGQAYVGGDKVQVLQVSPSGQILPPMPDGSPHPDNLPIDNNGCFIGHLVSSALVDSGLFSASIQIPPLDGTVIFCRAFNHENPAQATFYGDSQTFTVNGTQIFLAVIPATEIPMDAADDDGDGLNNSWEASYGSDRQNPDSDNDGMIDGHEHLAGSDILDPSSLLVIENQADAANPDDLSVSWQSVPGKCYQLEMINDLGAATPEFTQVGGPVSATSAQTTVVVPGGKLSAIRLFRVRLADCP